MGATLFKNICQMHNGHPNLVRLASKTQLIAGSNVFYVITYFLIRAASILLYPSMLPTVAQQRPIPWRATAADNSSCY